MKSLQIVAPNKVEIVDLPIPKHGDNEVLVKVKGVATCPHWDINMLSGTDIFERPGYPKYPIPAGYPGHEMSGEIVAIGKNVTRFDTGDRVAATKAGGETNQGFYCEYINRPAELIAKIPDNTSYEAGSVLELARYCASHVRATNYNELRVGVIGLGGGGLIALQLVKALGAREVVAIDVNPERLRLARTIDNIVVLNSSTKDGLAYLQEHPLDVSIDCSGVAAGLQTALDYTHGAVVIFGVVHGEAKYTMHHWRQRTYIAQRIGPDDSDTKFIQDMWWDEKLDTELLISESMPFTQYKKGVQSLIDKKAIKIFFYPH